MNNELAAFQTQHLFVLVGTNPLPNYVAAKLLLADAVATAPEKCPRLYLVHTKKTYSVANRLVGLFPGVVPEMIQVDENNTDDIYAQIKLPIHAESVGLNYTGGTKAMAVHTYQALRKLRPEVICSYLDARTLTLHIDRPSDPSQAIPVGLALQPPFEDLLALHGHELNPDKAAPISTPQHLDLARALVRAGLCKNMNNWSRVLYVGGHLKNEEQGVGETPLPTRNTHPHLAPLLSFWEGCATVGDLAQKWNTSVEDTAAWLAGKWLEHYTLAAVQDVADKCNIHFARLGINSRSVPTQASSGGLSKIRKFEIDVVALRGYRLFSLSCGTGDYRDKLKLKFFEAYVRARQLGGDEARVALVCCADQDDVANIQREIENEWDAEGVVRVFGRGELPQLSAHLKAWFLTGT